MTSGGWSSPWGRSETPSDATMTAPPFALPVPDVTDPPPLQPSHAAGPLDRARALAAAGALGATAIAATLAVVVGTAIFEHDVMEVVTRPGVVPWDISVAGLRDLASLPGPSLLVVAGLVPAVGMLLLAGLLRHLGRGAPPLHGISVEALAAAEATMAWAIRSIGLGVVLVFVVPALLGAIGIQLVSLTSGSMMPALPAGSLVIATAPADPAALQVGEIIVVRSSDGSRITHRVVGIVRDGGSTVAYRTRGDAIPAADPEPAPVSAIEGTVVAGLPVVGALRAWLASPLGVANGLVVAWAFAGLGLLLADDRRRVLAARDRAGQAGRAGQAVARSTIRPTS